MKTATPPKGVTARCVSRRIIRSPERRAVISCGTDLSGVFVSTPFYRKYLQTKYACTSEFRLIRTAGRLLCRNPQPSMASPAPGCYAIQLRQQLQLFRKE